MACCHPSSLLVQKPLAMGTTSSSRMPLVASIGPVLRPSTSASAHITRITSHFPRAGFLRSSHSSVLEDAATPLLRGRCERAWTRVPRCHLRARAEGPVAEDHHQQQQVPHPHTSQGQQQTGPNLHNDLNLSLKRWFAVQVVEQMDEKESHVFTVLNRQLVTRKTQDRGWVCLLDACTSCGAPLSEAAVEGDGAMHCRSCGEQVLWEGAHTGAMSQSGHAGGPQDPEVSCGTRIPTHEEAGVLWVWPHEDSWEEAMAKIPPPFPEYGVEGLDWSGTVRDLPASWEYVVENIVDPAHVTVAHHGCMGLDRSQAQPLALTIIEPANPSGFSGLSLDMGYGYMQAPSELKTSSTLTFYADRGLLVYYKISMSNRNPSGSETEASPAPLVFTSGIYVTPTRPGHSRLVMVAGNPPTPLLKLNRFVDLRFLGHMAANDVFCGDAMILHLQEIRRRRKARETRGALGYSPTSSELFVKEFQKYIAQYIGGSMEKGTCVYFPGEEWTANAYTQLEELPPEVVMDRFNQHTKFCRTCSNTLAMSRTAKRALEVTSWSAGAVAGALVLVLLGRALGSGGANVPGELPLWTALGAAVLAASMSALSSLGTTKLNQLIKELTYKGWNHSHLPPPQDLEIYHPPSTGDSQPPNHRPPSGRAQLPKSQNTPQQTVSDARLESVKGISGEELPEVLVEQKPLSRDGEVGEGIEDPTELPVFVREGERGMGGGWGMRIGEAVGVSGAEEASLAQLESDDHQTRQMLLENPWSTSPPPPFM